MAPPAFDELAVDETYVKVRGKWAYLYRALDKEGNTIDFYLADAERQSRKALPGQGAERTEGLGAAGYHQHRQGADIRYRNFRAEGRREVS